MQYALHLLLVLLLTGCAAQVAGELGADELKLSDDLRLKVASLASKSGAPSGLVTEAVLVSRARGDFGLVREWAQRSQAKATPDGLKDEVRLAVPKDPRLANEVSRTLSLCGLVQLLSESSSSPRGSEVTFIPAAKFTLPIVTAGALPTAERFRATAIEVQHPSPCSPQVGDVITVTVNGQLLRRAIGPVGTIQRIQEVQETMRCVVSASAIGDLPTVSQDDHLQVTCKHQSSIGFPIESTHAFLRAARQYVPLLTVRAEGTDTRYRYNSIDRQ